MAVSSEIYHCQLVTDKHPYVRRQCLSTSDYGECVLSEKRAPKTRDDMGQSRASKPPAIPLSARKERPLDRHMQIVTPLKFCQDMGKAVCTDFRERNVYPKIRNCPFRFRGAFDWL